MRQNIARLKYAFVGSPLRIARLPISVLPLFSFLLPLFSVSFYLPFFEQDKNFSLLGIIKQLPDITFAAIPDYLSSPVLGGASLRLLAAVLLIFISFVSLVTVSLGFLIANFKNLNSKGLFFTNLFAAGCMLASGFSFASFYGVSGAAKVAPCGYTGACCGNARCAVASKSSSPNSFRPCGAGGAPMGVPVIKHRQPVLDKTLCGSLPNGKPNLYA